MTKFRSKSLRELEKSALLFPGVVAGKSCVKKSFKAGNKGFLYLGEKDDALSIMVKLDGSLPQARGLAKKSGAYVVGKAGWVTVTFKPTARVPSVRLKNWISESFMNQAPKKLTEQARQENKPSKKQPKKALAQPAKKAKATKNAKRKKGGTLIKDGSVADYVSSVPEHQSAAFKKLRAVIKKNIPKGFKEMMNYKMLGYVVPHSRYPDGYHCDPKLPLPFVNLAAQKNYIAVYHMALYDQELAAWFTAEYKAACGKKPDMGKCCIRLKNLDNIPFGLIGELMTKVTVNDWIGQYEAARAKA